jgi:hypothetical protein
MLRHFEPLRQAQETTLLDALGDSKVIRRERFEPGGF